MTSVPTPSDGPERTQCEAAERDRSVAGLVIAGGAWGLAGRITILLVTLLATPFTIRLLGSSRYGLWALLQTSITWAALTDLGMATASTKFASERYAHRDSHGEAAVIWTALAITIVTTTCAATVVGIVAPILASKIFHVHGGLFTASVAALRLVAILFVAQAFAGIVNTPQLVRLRWRQYTVVTQGANLVRIVGVPVALAAASGGLITAAAVALAATVLGAAGNFMLGVRLLPAVVS